MSKILVTGGEGFIGSNLIKRLLKEGHQVVSIDNGHSSKHSNRHKGCWYLYGTPMDLFGALQHQEKTFDYIFHFGEYARVEQSFNDFDKVIDYNLRHFPELLKFAKHQDAKVIYSGSSTKFANNTSAASPYAYTKAQNTELLKNYSEWFGLDYSIVYFYNVYGDNEINEGQYATVVGKFIKMVQDGATTLPVTSPGNQVRNFTHVDDIVEGILLAAFKGSGDNYGIGSPEQHSILNLVSYLNVEPEMLPEKAGNRLNGELKTAKIIDLGWECKNSLKDYLENIINGRHNWYGETNE